VDWLISNNKYKNFDVIVSADLHVDDEVGTHQQEREGYDDMER